MENLLYIYLFVFGLILGSFYNVVGLRVPTGASIIKPRSHCPTCKHELTPVELIPVFSFLFLKGKCKKCGKKVSFLYPFIELLTAVLFVISPLFLGWDKELIIAIGLISLLMIILVSDVKFMLIPDKVLLFFFIIFIVLRFIIPLHPWWDPFAGSLIGFSLLFLLAVVSKGGMGGGDIKLFAVLGLVLGIKGVFLAFFFSAFSGAIIGVIGIAFGKMKRKEPVPFGPFIVIGTLISYFSGDELFSIYIQWISNF